MHRAEGLTAAAPDAGDALVVDGDPIGGWFGATVRRVADQAAEVEIPAPAQPGASPFARMVMAADTVGALNGYLAGAPSIVTANLELHVVADQVIGAVTARSHTIRASRRQVLVGITITDATGRVVALGTVDNAVLRGRLEMYYAKFAVGEGRDLSPSRTAPLGALADVFGNAAGELVVDERSHNALGVAHGAILASFIEPASRRSGIATIEDCVIRYLHPARGGPVTAATRSVADRGNSTLAIVQLSDSADGVVVVIAAVSGRPGPLDSHGPEG